MIIYMKKGSNRFHNTVYLREFGLLRMVLSQGIHAKVNSNGPFLVKELMVGGSLTKYYGKSVSISYYENVRLKTIKV